MSHDSYVKGCSFIATYIRNETPHNAKRARITDFRIVLDGTCAEQATEAYNITLISVRGNTVVDDMSISGTINQGEQNEFNVELDEETGEIIQIPEFPSLLILPVFIITTLLATLVYARKFKRYTATTHN